MSGSSMAIMAWRNLWRNRRRTLVTLSSIAFGFFLAVIFTGIGDSTYSDMIDLAAKMGGGHVTLQHPEYLETPSLKRTVREIAEKKKAVQQVENVEKVVARISSHIMLSTAANSVGAFFLAYDPAQEDDTTISVLDTLEEGELFSSSKGRGIILGAGLVENLEMRMGQKVVYTLTDKHGEIVTGLARLSGILRTGAASVDNALCLLPIDTVRETIDYEEDETTLVAVFIDDQRRSPAVAKQIGALMDDGTAALTWSQTQPDLAGFIAMKVGGTLFFEILIMILVAAGIFNTLFVSVMERIREFGIMMAIGFSPAKLFKLVMWESFWLGVTGFVSGVLVTAWPYYYFATSGIDYSAVIGEGGTDVAGVAMDPIMYVRIYPENAIIIAVVIILTTMVAGLYPAWRAGRVTPVEAIKLV
jgi:ABC-type lipoprotein release transport system permease subunit